MQTQGIEIQRVFGVSARELPSPWQITNVSPDVLGSMPSLGQAQSLLQLRKRHVNPEPHTAAALGQGSIQGPPRRDRAKTAGSFP